MPIRTTPPNRATRAAFTRARARAARAFTPAAFLRATRAAFTPAALVRGTRAAFTPAALVRGTRAVFAPAVLVAGVLSAGVLLLHRLIPGSAGSLAETFLSWLGLIIPLSAALAAWLRTVPAIVAAVIPLAAWLTVFGGHFVPARDVTPTLIAVQHNVSDENPDPAGTVRTLTAANPDLIGLEEITPAAYPAYAAALAAGYPHHTVQGTVALWSRHPLTEARALNIRPAAFGTDWNRGLRAVAHTPAGDVAVYVAHLPSVRLGPGGLDAVRRDESARLLGSALRSEPLKQTILLGDLNSTTDDRGLTPITAQLRTAESTFEFSWPASFPVARIDQILARSLTVTEVRTLPRTGSDHLPIAAHLTP
ncbi:endonuclease/exonuclease/phosphatase family protein [Actinoplanes sp. GCM10030250]|uniref:endonuclease/exonuclease/phosphatase family protein n=1 Tax=Actinoplanes sp. GCM10030250 TaxID=3273376 RepID=UPI00361FEF84